MLQGGLQTELQREARRVPQVELQRELQKELDGERGRESFREAQRELQNQYKQSSAESRGERFRITAERATQSASELLHREPQIELQSCLGELQNCFRDGLRGSLTERAQERLEETAAARFTE